MSEVPKKNSTPNLQNLQSDFWEAVLQPNAPHDTLYKSGLDNFVDPDAFSIYQSTIQTAHVEALKVSYQRLLLLLGDSIFTGLTRGYFIYKPPTSPNLIDYGSDFSDWLLQAKDEVPKLAKLFQQINVITLAKFEWAFEQGYYEADTAFTKDDMDRLANYSPTELCLKLHPSIQIFAMDLATLNTINCSIDNLKLPTENNCHDIKDIHYIVIYREQWQIEWKEITLLEYNLITALHQQKTIEQLRQIPDYEELILEQWMQSGWVVSTFLKSDDNS